MNSIPEEHPFTFVTNIKEPKANLPALQDIYKIILALLLDSTAFLQVSSTSPPGKSVAPSPGRITLNPPPPPHQQKPQSFSLHLPSIIKCSLANQKNSIIKGQSKGQESF